MAGDVHEQDQVVAPSNLDILEKQAGDMRNLERCGFNLKSGILS